MLNYRTITKQLLFCICSVEWSGAMIKYFVTKRDCQWIGLLSTLRTRATHRPASDQYSERSRRAAKSSPFRKRDDRRSVSETRPTYCLSRCLPRSRERERESARSHRDRNGGTKARWKLRLSSTSTSSLVERFSCHSDVTNSVTSSHG